MKSRYHSSEHSDVTESYLTPTDIKQYVFCPRVTYFTRVERLRPIMGSQQDAAKKDHKRLKELEERRKSFLRSGLPIDIKERQFEVYFRSDRLKCHGKLDMLVTTQEKQFIPVEFKAMESIRGNMALDHKYQLSLLALLTEENKNCIVRLGYIYYLEDEKTVRLSMTQNLKTRTKRYLSDIRKMINTGVLPLPRRQCAYQRVGCGFADQCRDFN